MECKHGILASLPSLRRKFQDVIVHAQVHHIHWEYPSQDDFPGCLFSSEESFGCLKPLKKSSKCTDSGGHDSILGPVRFQELRSKVISVVINICFFHRGVLHCSFEKLGGIFLNFTHLLKRWKCLKNHESSWINPEISQKTHWPCILQFFLDTQNPGV